MNPSQKIKVLIVDDHDLVRQGLTIMLETFDDFEVVAHTDDGRIAVSLCALHHPDVVLMDLMMPKMDGVTATRLLRDKFPSIEVIALTSSVEDSIIEQALKAGVIGYILKNGSIDELTNAVRDAYLGKHTLIPAAINVLMDVKHYAPRNDYFLSQKEYDILALMVKGCTNQQIADHLHLSQSTIKAYVSNIFVKLDLNSRSKVVAFVLNQRILENTKF